MVTQEQKTVLEGLQNPEFFLKEILGANPYDKQVEQINLIKNHRRVSVAGCNGSGKDWTSGRLVLWWMLTHYPAKVVVTGPTSRQVSDIVWNECRFAFNNSRYPLGGRMLPSASRWQFDEQHFAVGIVSSDPMNLQGFHSPNLLVIITEAHAVKQPDIKKPYAQMTEEERKQWFDAKVQGFGLPNR